MFAPQHGINVIDQIHVCTFFSNKRRFFYDLYAHMYGPEALVVGVVGHCPAKLLLRVEQLARTSRSGINHCKNLNVQHYHHYQVLTLKLVDASSIVSIRAFSSTTPILTEILTF